MVEKSCEMLVEKSKKKNIKDMFIFQIEDHLEVKEIRQKVDHDFFWHSEEELAEIDEESESEEE